MKIAIIALACLVACVSAGVHRDEPNIDIPSDKVSNLPTCTRKNIGSFHKHQHPLKYWECIVKKLFLIPYYYPAERDCKAWTFFSEKCGKCVRNPFNCDEKPEKPEPEPEPEEPILEPEEPEVTDAPTEEPPVEEVTEESPEDSESGSDSSESGSNSSESGSDSSESGSNSSESGSDSQEDSAEPIDPEDPELEPTDAPVDEEEPELEPTDAPVPEESGEVEPTDAPVPEDSGEVEPTDAPVPEESGEVEPTDAPVSEESGEEEPVDPEDPSCEVRCVRQEAEGNHVEEYYADPESCDHFWQCSNSVPHKFACPQGLIWNPTANPGPVCDWPRNYQCTEKPGCQAPEPQPDPCEKPVCSEHVDQDYGEYHSNPADCESYYQCTQNADLSWSPTLMPCPKGLQWNSALDTCDWPAEAKCTVTCSKHKGIFF